MQQDIIYNVFDPLSRGELWSVKIKHHTKINFWCQVQQVSELFRKNVPQRYFGSMTLWTLFLNRRQCVLDVRLMTPIKWVLESVFYIYILYKWTVWWIHDSVLVNLFFTWNWVYGFFFSAGPGLGESEVKTEIACSLSEVGLLCSTCILF